MWTRGRSTSSVTAIVHQPGDQTDGIARRRGYFLDTHSPIMILVAFLTSPARPIWPLSPIAARSRNGGGGGSSSSCRGRLDCGRCGGRRCRSRPGGGCCCCGRCCGGRPGRGGSTNRRSRGRPAMTGSRTPIRAAARPAPPTSKICIARRTRSPALSSHTPPAGSPHLSGRTPPAAPVTPPAIRTRTIRLDMIARCYHPWSSQLRRHRSKIPPRAAPSASCNIDAGSERPDRIRIGDRRRQTRRRNPQRQPTARPLHPPRAASARPAPRRSRS